MNQLLTFVLAMLPLGEMRLSIPFAVARGIPASEAIALSVLGALIPALLIIWLTASVLEILERHLPPLHKLARYVLDHAKARSGRGFALLNDGVVLLLASIPVPVLGGSYTAALAAVVFGTRARKALILIICGLIIQAFLINYGLVFFKAAA